MTLAKKERFWRDKLSAKDKLAIVRKARKILGPNGENWIKNQWFGVRMAYGDIQGAGPLNRKDANCFCLGAALDKAATDLGYKEYLETSEETGIKASVCTVVTKIRRRRGGQPQKFITIPQFNDNYSTTWEDVDKVLQKRETQLLEEIG